MEIKYSDNFRSLSAATLNNNKFAPFTWEIEGLKKPGKVLSNVPTTVMSKDQNPMGMPIKRPYKPDEQVSDDVVKADENNELSTDES